MYFYWTLTNFWYSASIMDTALLQKLSFIVDRNLAKETGFTRPVI